MKISNPQEESNYTPKKIFLGKAGYHVVAVNPDNKRLEELNQYTTDSEPDYNFTREIDGVNHSGINITIYLQNISDNSIIDKVVYSLINTVQVSSTNKFASINSYGADCWLDEEFYNTKVLPDNMNWYVNEGVKKAIRGEKELVNFIRTLRNFKKISLKSTTEEKQSSVSLFNEEDLNKMLSGNFTDIRNIIMPKDVELKVGFLLGARTNQENKIYQDLFKEYPLRSYMVNSDSSNEYIVKQVSEAQSGGKYSNTYFNLNNLNFIEYNESNKISPDKEDETLFEDNSFLDGGSNDNDDLGF